MTGLQDYQDSRDCRITILDLGSEDATLEVAGGKGANLATLVRAGFAVPKGFVISTAAYDAFVEANDLHRFILEAAASASVADPESLESASSRIRQRMEAGRIPVSLATEIREAYAELGAPPVAVRSSATAEDLPDMSFAGQQDTFLNVVGDESLLYAVIRCWSSLWTARAIGYRSRNGREHDDVLLAVIVQEMVASESSGVAFTANPLTGKRSETVIDATYGLGEALVSGLVEPDHYVVGDGRILTKTLGAKALAIEAVEGGGTRQIQTGGERREALPDAAVLDLEATGRSVEALFASPQDIEWAWADGRMLLLQSRPITSLFPVPENLESGPLRVLFSFGAVQGMLAPITPFGRDLFRLLGATLGRNVGNDPTLETQRFVTEAAERLFIDVTPAMRNRWTRQAFREAVSNVEPGIANAIDQVSDDPALSRSGSWPRFATVWIVSTFAIRMAFGVLRALLWPEASRTRAQAHIETFVASIRERSLAAKTLGARLDLLEAFPAALVSWLAPQLMPVVAAGVASLAQLVKLASGAPGGHRLALEATRGLAHNVTTEMDLALWNVARLIRSDPASTARFAGAKASVLASEARNGQLPPVAQDALDGFLENYGSRGVAEIDIGRPRWREDPTPLVEVIGSYLQISGDDAAPDAVFARGAQAAGESTRELVAALRKTRFGWLKAPLARWLASRMQTLAGMRESPKFTAIRAFGLVREALLESGRDCAAAGTLENPEDLFFLRVSELRSIAAGETRDWRPIVSERKTLYERETMRRQIPRVLLSDGRAFFGGGKPTGETEEGTLVGTPVSPGVVEGFVRVVFDPHEARLEPGEILVCPGTDPAWTPLFLAAGGLVTEVGGLITHGSVVAREYGIPAVVGVDSATTQLVTGQRVRVDGSAGVVTVLEDRDA